MELKLIVLAGAKEGTQIPLKKDKFIIGRASECTLRAGSSAISRRHCAIVRKDDAWLVRDLGSRNGTFLNDQAVEKPTPLKVGDEIRVGPLHFRVEPLVKAGDGSKASKPATEAKAATPAEPVDVKRGKQPPAKDVTEVVQRTAGKGDGSTSEEDISRWLLGHRNGRKRRRAPRNPDAEHGGDHLHQSGRRRGNRRQRRNPPTAKPRRKRRKRRPTWKPPPKSPRRNPAAGGYLQAR